MARGFDIDQLIKEVQDLDYIEMVARLNGALAVADRDAETANGRKSGAVRFAFRLRAILSWLLDLQIKPKRISAADWQICEFLTRRVVGRGVRPEVLRIFE
jgi:hypothetical protein